MDKQIYLSISQFLRWDCRVLDLFVLLSEKTVCAAPLNEWWPVRGVGFFMDILIFLSFLDVIFRPFAEFLLNISRTPVKVPTMFRPPLFGVFFTLFGGHTTPFKDCKPSLVIVPTSRISLSDISKLLTLWRIAHASPKVILPSRYNSFTICWILVFMFSLSTPIIHDRKYLSTKFSKIHQKTFTPPISGLTPPHYYYRQ